MHKQVCDTPARCNIKIFPREFTLPDTTIYYKAIIKIRVIIIRREN